MVRDSLHYENRIHKLEAKDAMRNLRLINKMKRKIRNLSK